MKKRLRNLTLLKGSRWKFQHAQYLDDGTLYDGLDDLVCAFAIIEAEDPVRGLHLNRSKSLLHAVADAPTFLVSQGFLICWVLPLAIVKLYC